MPTWGGGIRESPSSLYRVRFYPSILSLRDLVGSLENAHFSRRLRARNGAPCFVVSSDRYDPEGSGAGVIGVGITGTGCGTTGAGGGVTMIGGATGTIMYCCQYETTIPRCQ